MSDAADDSDEDLKRAIAMSLEDSTAQHDQRISSVLDLVSDSDDDDDLDAPVTNRRTLATPTRSEIKSAASQPHAIISEITAVTERKGVTAQVGSGEAHHFLFLILRFPVCRCLETNKNKSVNSC